MIKQVLLIAFLTLPLHAQLAHITIEPDTVVEIGQEVFFTAARGAGNTDVAKDTFYWDFGDSYSLKWEYPARNSNASGLSCTHFYMHEGTYTVTLTVHDAGGAVDSTTKTVRVTGTEWKYGPRPADDPLVEVNFENSAVDSSPSGLSVTWHGTVRYDKGMEGMAADLTGGAYLEVSDPSGVLGGMDELTVSFWVKKRTPAAVDGTVRLLEKTGSYFFWAGGTQALGRVYTAAGNQRAGDYNFYPLGNGCMWHHVALVYDGDSVRVYIDRRQEGEVNALTGAVVGNTNSLTLGKGSRDNAWDGLIDEVKIYDRALSVHEIFDAFEVWHAPFQGRIGQYLYAQIPGDITEVSTNRLRMAVAGDNGHTVTLLDKTGLSSEEVGLLVNKDLPVGNYIFTAELLDASGNVLEVIKEEFAKPYDGAPRMGINQYNALCVNENPFYFTRGLGLDAGYIMNWWAMGGYITSVITEGWNAAHTVASYGQHLDQAEDLGLTFVGPGGYWVGRRDLYYERNSNVDDMIPYFEAYKDHPGQLAWFFDDEPNLGGYNQTVPAPVLRSWSHYMNRYCPQQLSAVSYAGSGYFRGADTWHRENIEKYSYLSNTTQFGKKTNVTDLIWWDAYPSEQGDQAPEPENVVKWWAHAMHVARDMNYDLVPIINCMETQDIQEEEGLRGPTPEEVRMMAWLNVVHGQKGVAWFHYFEPTPAEAFTYMKEFTKYTNELAPVILGPEAAITIIDDADVAGKRVDTGVWEDDDHYYLVAVRLTERWETDNPSDITVNFSVPSGGSGTVIAPGAYPKTAIEYRGDPAVAKQSYNLTLNGGDSLVPGTIQLVGGTYGANKNDLSYVWDDGGTLFRLYSNNVKNNVGTVNYSTGLVTVNFGLTVPAGTLNVICSYQPGKADETFATMSGGSFSDTFKPNDVKIYLIDKSTLGIKDKTERTVTPQMRVTVAPNPMIDDLTITVKTETPHPYSVEAAQGRRGVSTVRVMIFDQSGNTVYATMPETSRRDVSTQGRGMVTWDGNGISGEPVKPGIYFYMVETSGGVVSGKIVKR